MWLACDCGCDDCPDCGPAQGFKVVQAYRGGRPVWINPEPDAEPVTQQDDFDAPYPEDNEP